MATPAFFTAALSVALEQGQATAQDILAFATPEVIAASLPRPLWTRLLTAALGAPGLAPADVVDTVGIANLCEHVPAPILWRCLATIAERSLAGTTPGTERPSSRGLRTPPPPAVIAPPPAAAVAPAPPPAVIAPAAPPPVVPAAPPPIMPPSPAAAERGRAAADAEVDSALESLELGDEPRPYRPPSMSSGRPMAGASSRRPQRRSVAPEPIVPSTTAAPDESTRASARELDVLDEQLVEWSPGEETKNGPT